MIWNECKRIWNIKSIILVLLVGGIMFFGFVLNQMQVAYSWEEVQAKVGRELVRQYGPSIAKSKISELKEKEEEAKGRLEQKKKESKLESDWEREEAEVEYYKELISFEDADSGAARWGQLFGDGSSGLVKERVKQIADRDYISFLPSSVYSNTNFTLIEFSNMALLLTIILIVPYIMLGNRSRIYPVVASTRVGRGFLLRQIGAVLLSTTILYGICAIAFLIAYWRLTPYLPFLNCMINYSWFDLTLSEYVVAQLAFLYAICLLIALLCVFATSFCQTVVGMMIAALPCVAAAEFFVVNFFGHMLFRLPDGEYTVSEYIFSSTKMNPFIIVVVLLCVGVILNLAMYRRRKREDI